MPVPCVYNRWLPDQLAKGIESEEPARYTALIERLESQWQQDLATKSLGEATNATIPYLSLLKTFFQMKTPLPRSMLDRQALLLLDIVQCSTRNLAVQSRWTVFLTHFLRQHRRRLRVRLAWRPFYHALAAQNLAPRAEYEGGTVAEHRREHLVRLIVAARRLFARGAAAEIVEEFAPALRGERGYEALGWLALLLPTSGPGAWGGAWGAWAQEWLDVWQQLAHCYYWDSLWHALFARLAHDGRAAGVDWRGLAPRLLTHALWAFDVPVGSALAQAPWAFEAPSACEGLFVNCLASRAASVARLLVGALGSGADEEVLGGLEALTSLLEQYYHPSNGGRWSSSLAAFLRELVAQLCDRLVREHNRALGPRRRADAEGSQSADEDEEHGWSGDESDSGDELEEAALEREADVLSATSSSESSSEEDDMEGVDGAEHNGSFVKVPPLAARSASGNLDRGPSSRPPSRAASAAAPQPPPRGPIAPQARARVVAAALRIARKAQFSKDRELWRAATTALALLSDVAPRAVLPLVYSNLSLALETLTSAAQIGIVTQTLSLCVRPLLVAGLDPAALMPGEGAARAGRGPAAGSEAAEEDEAAFADVEVLRQRQVAGAAAVCSAMLAMLPGIDANDPPKSLAAFRFYCAVLSCVGALPEAPSEAFPLDVETWAEDLLSHIFAVITNLDAPELASGAGHEAGKETTFLLDSRSMFRPLMDLLFVRLPPALRCHCVQRVARFLLRSSLTSVTAEAGTLCSAVAAAAPDAVGEHLLAPLLRGLRRDVQGLGREAAPSKVQENDLRWRLNLLSNLLPELPAQAAAFEEDLAAVLDALFGVPSNVVQEAAMHLLSATLGGLVEYKPEGSYEPSSACVTLRGTGLRLEACMSRDGVPGDPPRWQSPSDAETRLVRALLERYLLAPARALRAACADGSVAASFAAETGAAASGAKRQVRAWLASIYGALVGASGALPDLGAPPLHGGAVLLGRLGPGAVGSADDRAEAARALIAGMDALRGADSDTLSLLWLAVDALLASGSTEYADAVAAVAAWAADERWMAERPLSERLLELGASRAGESGGEEGPARAVEGGSARTVEGGSAGAIEVGSEKIPGDAGLAPTPPPEDSLERRPSSRPPLPARDAPARGQRWTRRRPRWLLVEKTALNLRWRASQATYRWWVTADEVVLPAPRVPELVRELLARALEASLHPYKDVRALGSALVEKSLKQYPALVPHVAVPVLRAVAKLPAGPVAWDATLADVVPELRHAALDAPARAAAARDPESEEEQAPGLGAMALLRTGRSIWRHVASSWPALQAIVAALQASAGHTSVEASQSALMTAFVYGLRFYQPQQADESAAEAVLDDLAQVAAGHVPHWRYRVLAASLHAMLLPALTPAAGRRLGELCAGLLVQDQVLLRQLAAATLLAALRPVWMPEPAGGGLLPAHGLRRVPALGRGGRQKAAAPGAAAPGADWPDAELRAAETRAGGVPRRDPAPAAAEAARAALAEAVTPAFVRQLFLLMARSHLQLAGEESAGRAGMNIAGIEDALSKIIGSNITQMTLWPRGRFRLGAAQEGWFLTQQAALVQLLARLRPEVVLPALREPIERALLGPQHLDRPATAAAAETLAGLLASHAPWEDGSWEAWVRPALARALHGAPPQYTFIWGGAVLKYAVLHLLEAGRVEAFEQICALLLGGLDEGRGGPNELDPNPTAGPSSANGPAAGPSPAFDPAAGPSPASKPRPSYKRLRYLSSVLLEALGVGGTAGGDPSVLEFQAALLEELAELQRPPGGAAQLVRAAGARLAAAVPAALLDSLASAQGAAGLRRGDADRALDGRRAELAARARGYLDGLVADFARAVAVLAAGRREGGEAVRAGFGPARQVGGGGVDDSVGDGAGPSAVDVSPSEDGRRADMGLAHAGVSPTEFEAMEHDAVDGALEGGAGEEERAEAAALQDASEEEQGALVTIAFVVEFVVEALYDGNGPQLGPWLVDMLPGLLKIQELIPSKLQFVSLSARKALSSLRYLPLYSLELVEKVERVLCEATASDLWSERAAALVFMQCFWFHAFFMLSHQSLVKVVVERLSDSKLEVRELASSTLSGLLKGMREEHSRALLASFLTKAKTLLPSRRRWASPDVPAETSTSLPVRHAAVLGLRAFVLSSPYDVPAWLPEVLMALVRLAPEPPPVSTTVTKTLAEFRRTHEEVVLASVRDVLTSEQWEAIRDVAHPVTYFV